MTQKDVQNAIEQIEEVIVNGGGMLGHWGVDVQGKGPS